MSNDNVTQKVVTRRRLGAPENRGALFVGTTILVVLIVIGAIAYSYLTPEAQVDVKTGQVDASNLSVDADAQTSEAYKEAKRDENSERYETAKTDAGGVALPFTFDEEPKGRKDGKDISNCGCTIDDKQLKDAIKRLGLGDGDSGDRDHMRVAKSDIYMSTKGQLMGEDGEPLEFRKAPIFMESDGQLLDEKGVSILSRDKEPLYLGKQGNIIDRQARTVPLLGDLTMANGALLINDGRLANRPGNLQRVGRSDVYITSEGQLVTMDGKPVRHSGDYVFQDDERKLINRGSLDVGWEKRAVYQSKRGELVDVSGKKFNQPGILFSYEGILIDNDGMLTRPLVSIEQVGESDIYKTKSGHLVDSYGLAITHYGAKIRIGPGDKLLTSSGQPVFNRNKAEVYVTGKGALRADVGKGGVQSGALKGAESVALDRQGQMITRRGRLEQRGSSDIHLTADGFLADKEGKPILFLSKDTFVDFASIMEDGSQGLETFDYVKVVDSSGNRVFLTLDGRLVDAKGKSVKEVGVLSGSDGVLLTSFGKKIVQDGTLERVVTKDGKRVTYKGKEVFKGDDGRLYDADGAPILTEDGRAVFLDEDGNLVDESGRIVDDVDLIAGERAVKSGELATVESSGFENGVKTKVRQITSSDGKPVLFNGKEVFADKNGRLVDEDGNVIRTGDGREIFIDENGNIVDKNGDRVTEKLLTDSTGSAISSGLKKGAEKTLTIGGVKSLKQLNAKDGSSITVDGKPVFVDEDGRVVDENGKPIRTKDGREVYVDEDGNLVDKDGNKVDEALLEAVGSRSVEPGEVSSVNQLTDANGETVFYDGKKVYTDKKGRLVDEHGNVIKTADGREVFVDKDGNLVDDKGQLITEDLLQDIAGMSINSGLKKGKEKLVTKDGSSIKYKGADVFKSKDGSLVDENGHAILTEDGKKIYVNEAGQLIDEDGKLVTDDAFTVEERAFVNHGLATGAEKLLTKDGKPLTFDGKSVFKAKDGSLIDSQGEPILTKDGKKIFVDADGRLVDEDGQVVDDPRFDALDQVTTKDGKPVQYDGKNVYKKADGSLVDQNGDDIRTSDGRKVYMNEDGELVDVDGNIVTEYLLSEGAHAAKPGSLESVADSELRKVGDSDIYVTRDGTLLDKNGKAITFNGKKVRVGKNGQLFDEDGVPVTDKNGEAVFMNAKGELVDSKGIKIDDSVLADGDGVLLDASGKSVAGTLTKVGDSDIYKTSDGRLVDKDGKAIQFEGENVYVGDDGRLYHKDGKPVTDKNGNSVYLDPATGKLVDRNGKAIDGALLTNGEGTLIDSNGELVTAGGKLKRIPGTDLYRTEDGQVVDSSGKPVMVNGEPAYVDESGKVVNKYGKPVRFKGQELYIADDGRLVDRNGQPVLDDDKRSIQLSEDGGIVNEDGEAVDGASKADATKGFKKTVVSDDSNVAPVVKPERQTTNKPSTSAAPSKPATMTGKKPAGAQGPGLDQASTERLERRYSAIKAKMRNQLMDAKTVAGRKGVGGFVAVGGNAESGLHSEEKKSGKHQKTKAVNLKSDGDGDGDGDGELINEGHSTGVAYKKAGTMLYAVSSYQVNSDYLKDTSVDIVGLPPKHPLHNAKAMGSFELAYDRMVLTFDRICPEEGECLPMNGVALDPATSSAGLASGVDHHYWYRYGGLFLSSLLEGTADAMSESGTREESTSLTGTRSTTTGLDGDKLILRSFGKVGERFSDALADNVDRPPTAWLDPGEEMAIMLFDDIKEGAE